MAAALLLLPAWGRTQADSPEGGFFAPDSTRPPLAQVRLIAEEAFPAPGDTTWMALAFTIPEGWHLYWKGFNDSGLEPTMELTLPQGYRAGPLEWPVPRRKVTANMIVDHIYEHTLILPFPVILEAGADPGAAARFEAKVDWLICQEACIPEQATVSRTLAGKGAQPPWSPEEAQGIREALKQVPPPAPAGVVESAWKGSTLTLHVPGARRLEFFPHRDGAMPLRLLQQGARDGDTLAVDFQRSPAEQGVSGVLGVHTTNGTTWYHIQL